MQTRDTTINIAIADDHTLFRKGLIELILSFGHNIIIEAKNGQHLIEALQHASDVPDVCILDVNMPVLNGYETVLQIKEHWPEIKVLALSMHDSDFSVIKMIRNGANAYLLKDAEPEELEQAINDVHIKGYYHSDLSANSVVNQIKNFSNPLSNLLNIPDHELKYLQYLCLDLSIKEISELMHVRPRTLEKYSESLFKKLQIKSRTGLVMFAVRTGIIPLA